MGHSYWQTNYTEKLVVRNGNIYRVISAQYKDRKKLEVLYQSVNSNKVFIRNLDCKMICGWVYYDPQDKDRNYWSSNCGKPYGIDEWWVCACNCSLTGKSSQDYDRLEAVILSSKQKDFIYSFRAYRQAHSNRSEISISQIFELLQMWTKHPQNEFLIKLGYYKLALSKTLLTMSKNKQKDYIQYLVNDMSGYKGSKECLNLTELKCLMNNITNYELFCSCCRSLPLYHYLEKQKESVSYYKDYKNLCIELGKDLTDNYWLYPSNLRERHNLVMEQVIAQRNALEEAKEKEYDSKLEKVVKKLSKLNTTINGYEICVASSMKDIREQADTLAQCLITNNYYEKYAQKKCILVFVKKGNERLATAEVFYNKNKPLGQFYGDERDRNNCIPNKRIKGAFNTWLNNVYLTSNFARA